MGFFDTEEGVLEYERMAEGFDGRELVDRLRRHLTGGSSVLELGMGPGKDLDMLLEHFEAVGSDSSAAFVEHYRKRGGRGQVMHLDAVDIQTDRQFDAVYSNKVLQHLTRDEVRRSLGRQVEVVRPGGIALHSLWYGTKEEQHAGLRFIHYTQESFAALLPEAFSVVEQEVYTEMAKDDSLVVVLRRTDADGASPGD